MVARSLGLAVCALLLVASPAAAAPDCANAPTPRTLLSGQGVMESVVATRGGHLLFTTTPSGGSGELMRMEQPGGQPHMLIDGIDSPGGMVFLRHRRTPAHRRRLLLGYGNSFSGGAQGNENPQAGLLRVNPRTGAHSTYVTGLSMANGVARGPDGAIYASDDAGTGVDRVIGRQVENGWAGVVSSNGLVVDRAGRYLYVAQTFQPAAIKRIEIADPKNITTFAAGTGSDIFAGPDGMTRDGHGNLFVAANGAGQVWRVDRQGRICVVGGGLTLVSAVAFGHGTRGFRSGNLYAVTFSGDLIEYPNAVATRYPG